MAYFQQTCFENTAKTEFMLKRPRQIKLSTLSSLPELSIDNFPIEQVAFVNRLELYTD